MLSMILPNLAAIGSTAVRCGKIFWIYVCPLGILGQRILSFICIDWRQLVLLDINRIYGNVAPQILDYLGEMLQILNAYVYEYSFRILETYSGCNN